MTTFILRPADHTRATRRSAAANTLITDLLGGRDAPGGFRFAGAVESRSISGRLGVTRWLRDGRLLVLLSWPHLAYSEWSDVQDTIRHEAAHVMSGPDAGHGPQWQEWARDLGATPEPAIDLVIPKKYEAECCGETFRWGRHRPGSWYTCPTCGSRMDKVTQNW